MSKAVELKEICAPAAPAPAPVVPPPTSSQKKPTPSPEEVELQEFSRPKSEELKTAREPGYPSGTHLDRQIKAFNWQTIKTLNLEMIVYLASFYPHLYKKLPGDVVMTALVPEKMQYFQGKKAYALTQHPHVKNYLLSAIERGDIDTARMLLGGAIAHTNRHIRAALSAIRESDKSMAPAWLFGDAKKALTLAIKGNCSETIRVMLEALVEAEKRGVKHDFNARAALKDAIGDINQATVLVLLGDTPYSRALLCMLKAKETEMAGRWLDADGVDPNDAVESKEDPADVKLGFKEIALQEAVQLGSSQEMVKAILAAGANPNAKDQNGETALHLSARLGHQEIVDTLIGPGAKFDAKNKQGETPLHLAVRHGHVGIVDKLLKLDPSANSEALLKLAVENATIQTTLKLAVAKGYAPTGRILVPAWLSKYIKQLDERILEESQAGYSITKHGFGAFFTEKLSANAKKKAAECLEAVLTGGKQFDALQAFEKTLTGIGSGDLGKLYEAAKKFFPERFGQEMVAVAAVDGPQQTGLLQ